MIKDDKKKIIIIDSNSVIHRAYHALPKLTTKNGKIVNAVYGFLLVFLKAINDFKPDYVVAAFDFPAPTLRHKIYKEYKAKRPKAPEDLYAQIPLVKEFLNAFEVKTFEKEGFEADDIIGTVVNKTEKTKGKITAVILSGDSDTFQLVSPSTMIYILRKGVKDTVIYDEKIIIEKFSLTPKQLLDLKALRGDSSDNIPGVKGVGEKTARKLISEFGSLESLYEEINRGSSKSKEIKDKLRQLLLSSQKTAFLSKELATIEKNVPIDFDLGRCSFGNYQKPNVIEKLKNFDFYSLIKRIDSVSQKEDCPEKNISEQKRLL